MSDFTIVSKAQLNRIKPYFPLSHTMPHVDNLRIISGIIYVIRNGLLWRRDAPPNYGPHKTLYNRFDWGAPALIAPRCPGWKGQPLFMRQGFVNQLSCLAKTPGGQIMIAVCHFLFSASKQLFDDDHARKKCFCGKMLGIRQLIQAIS